MYMCVCVCKFGALSSCNPIRFKVLAEHNAESRSHADLQSKWSAYTTELRTSRAEESGARDAFKTPPPAYKNQTEGPAPMSGVTFGGKPTFQQQTTHS